MKLKKLNKEQLIKLCELRLKHENKDFIERCKKSFENLRKMYN